MPKRSGPESGGVDASETFASLDDDRPGEHGTSAEERTEAIAVGAEPTPIAAEQPKAQKVADVHKLQRWLGAGWSNMSHTKFVKHGIDTPQALANFKKILAEYGIGPSDNADGRYQNMVNEFKRVQDDVREGKNLDMKKH